MNPARKLAFRFAGPAGHVLSLPFPPLPTYRGQGLRRGRERGCLVLRYYLWRLYRPPFGLYGGLPGQPGVRGAAAHLCAHVVAEEQEADVKGHVPQVDLTLR